MPRIKSAQKKEAAQAAFFFDVRYQNFLLFLLPIGWIVPNHYFPWTAAWSDAATIFIFLLLVLSLQVGRRYINNIPSWPICLTSFFGAAVCCFQWVFGEIIFRGDLILVLAYLSLFILAAQTGKNIAELGGVEWFFRGVIFFSLVSVAIALSQALQVEKFQLYLISVPPGGRPFGNFSQPNNFASACFLGILAAGWFYCKEKISRSLMFVLTVSFALGLVLSGSRSALAQFSVISVVFYLARKRFAFQRAITVLCSSALAYAVFRVLFPILLQIILLPPGRSIEDQLKPGLRMEMWKMAIQAIIAHPWKGYGWQQGSAAQQEVALFFPPHGEHFEHAHNLVLDLLLWNGIPAGGAIIGLLIYWAFRSAKNAASEKSAGGNNEIFGFAIVAALLVHSLLEYPLEYAYFLIPFGVAIGLVDFKNSKENVHLVSSKFLFFFLAIISAAVFLALGLEYLKAEERFREFRLQASGIGLEAPQGGLDGYRLLDQLDHYFSFAGTQAKTRMSPAELNEMKHVAQRFGYPPVLFRYALALGLNADPDGAVRALDLICHIHAIERCKEAVSGWRTLQEKDANLPYWSSEKAVASP